MNSTAFTRTLAHLDAVTADGTMPGASVLVMRDGDKLLEYAAGHARIEPPRPAATDTVWAVASISKPVSTTALMRFVDRGLLSLDTPVAGILHDYGPDREDVLVRHLVTHTSGLADELLDPVVVARQGIAQVLASLPLAFKPGTACLYSTLAFELVKAVLIKLSGKSWAEIMQEEIFTPLGMTNSAFSPLPEWGERRATVYPADNDSPSDFWENPGFLRWQLAGASLYSTLQDLAAFGQAFVEGGRGIISPQAYEEMTRVQTEGLRNPQGELQTWGLGWYLNKTAREGSSSGRYFSDRSFGHGGASGTYLSVDPANGLVLVFLANRADIDGDKKGHLEGELSDAVMEDLGLVGNPRF